MNKSYPKSVLPKRAIEPDGSESEYSVDVFARDADELLYVAYFDYQENCWEFHSDIDGDSVNFVWMYAPEELKF